MAFSVSLGSVDGVVAEITRLHRSLPLRPGIDEVLAAKNLVQNVEKDKESKIAAIVSKQRQGQDVPEQLFKLLVDMQKSLISYQGFETKREASNVLQLENLHLLFDDLGLRASKCVSSSSPAASYSKHLDYSNGSASTISSSNISPSSSSVASSGPANVSARNNSTTSLLTDKESIKSSRVLSKDDSYVQTGTSFFSDKTSAAAPAKDSSNHQTRDSTLNPDISTGQDGGNKLSFIKLVSLIEVSSKKGARELNLQGKLQDGVSRLPDSIGKLSKLMTLDLSKNQLVVLPSTVGTLISLTKLNLLKNGIEELPEEICNLHKLVVLDLSANQLKYLPGALGKLVHLEELHLSSNQLYELPESIGSLIRLKKLLFEANVIEEIPHSVGHCSTLRELRADYNKLKALPEAVGRIESLEVLSVRHNKIKHLPTTMSCLVKLRELDVSDCELESIPESLCFATSLLKMNVCNNFVDLVSLPRSIGNLERLEELDISNNQIRFLPESFRLLTHLRILRAEGNPVEVPPRHIVENGAQAVVNYMADLYSSKSSMSESSKQNKFWPRILSCLSLPRRRNNAADHINPRY